MSNYYVRRTGDDSDYLEHMVVQGSGGTNGRPSWRARAHKYIQKINIGGKVRYIYDQAQLARVNAGKFIDRNITGASARGRMNRLGSQRQRMLKGSGRGLNGVNQAYNKAKSSYNRSLAGRIGNAANAVGKFAGQQRDRAVNAYENASDWMEKQRKKASVNARVTKKKIKNKVKKTKSNVKNTSKNAYLGFKNITTGRKA